MLMALAVAFLALLPASALAQPALPLTAVIGVDPTVLDFGRVPYQQTQHGFLDVFNAGDPGTVLQVTAITIVGDGMTVGPPFPPFSLPVGVVRPVLIGVTPVEAGMNEGTVTVEASNAPNSPVVVPVIVIGDTPPVCDAGGPYAGTTGAPVVFEGSGSSDEHGIIVTYDWRFGDGSIGQGVNASHAYSDAGEYLVTLTVTDDLAQQTSCNATVTIEGPTCNAGGPYFGLANLELQFDGSGSSAPSGIVSYDWAFGDGSTGQGVEARHVYGEGGAYTVTLCVRDNDDINSCCATTASISGGPSCDAGGPYSGAAGEDITFDGGGSDGPLSPIVSYAWDFGDGNAGEGIQVTHAYTGPGTYTVTLCVTDELGNTTCCTASAYVPLSELPVCQTGGPYRGAPHETLTFDGSGSTDPDGTIVDYAWQFGDGQTGTGAVVTHAYARIGLYSVTLCLTDDAGDHNCCATTASIAEVVNCSVPFAGGAGAELLLDGGEPVDGHMLVGDRRESPSAGTPFVRCPGELFQGDLGAELGIGCSNGSGTSGGPNDVAVCVTASMTGVAITSHFYNVFTQISPTITALGFVAWSGGGQPGDEFARQPGLDFSPGSHTVAISPPILVRSRAFYFGHSQPQTNVGMRWGVDSSSGSAGVSVIRAPTCGADVFMTLDSLGFPGNWVMSVCALGATPVELTSWGAIKGRFLEPEETDPE